MFGYTRSDLEIGRRLMGNDAKWQEVSASRAASRDVSTGIITPTTKTPNILAGLNLPTLSEKNADLLLSISKNANVDAQARAKAQAQLEAMKAKNEAAAATLQTDAQAENVFFAPQKNNLWIYAGVGLIFIVLLTLFMKKE